MFCKACHIHRCLQHQQKTIEFPNCETTFVICNTLFMPPCIKLTCTYILLLVFLIYGFCYYLCDFKHFMWQLTVSEYKYKIPYLSVSLKEHIFFP